MDSYPTSSSSSSSSPMLQQYNNYQYNIFARFYPDNNDYYNVNCNNSNDNVQPINFYQNNNKLTLDNTPKYSNNTYFNYNTDYTNNYFTNQNQQFYDYSCFENAAPKTTTTTSASINDADNLVRSITPENKQHQLINDSGIGISPSIISTSLEDSANNITQEYTKMQTPTSKNYEIQNIQNNSSSASSNKNNVNNDQDDSLSNSENDNDDTNDDDFYANNKQVVTTSSLTLGKKDEKNASLMKPPKPYLEIIADAILTAPDRMMQLHEIYYYMEKKYPYFAQNVNKSWRNSVRHNLSLNECFVKAGRGTNGKGNYWKIHHVCEPDFIRGNFRRKNFKLLIKANSNSLKQQQQQQPSRQPQTQQQQQQQQRPQTSPVYNSNLNSLNYFNSQLQSFGLQNFLQSTSQINSFTNNQTQPLPQQQTYSSNLSSHRYQPY